MRCVPLDDVTIRSAQILKGFLRQQYRGFHVYGIRRDKGTKGGVETHFCNDLLYYKIFEFPILNYY
jgi:hypothetical protein